MGLKSLVCALAKRRAVTFAMDSQCLPVILVVLKEGSTKTISEIIGIEDSAHRNISSTR